MCADLIVIGFTSQHVDQCRQGSACRESRTGYHQVFGEGAEQQGGASVVEAPAKHVQVRAPAADAIKRQCSTGNQPRGTRLGRFADAMQQVRCPTGQEQDVARSHRQALAVWKFDPAFSRQDNVIGRFSQGFLLVIECPVALELTPQIHATPYVGQADEFIDRIHLSASHKNLSGSDKTESRPGGKLSLSKQYTNLLRSHAMFNNWSELLPTIQKAFGALGRSNPKMVKAYMALGEASAENEVLDAKTRELISIAVAVTTRCDGCIAVHADAAIKAGASREEVAATLATAVSLNAGAAYIYSLRTLEAYDSLKK